MLVTVQLKSSGVKKDYQLATIKREKLYKSKRLKNNYYPWSSGL